jgi:hypothetical protein
MVYWWHRPSTKLDVYMGEGRSGRYHHSHSPLEVKSIRLKKKVESIGDTIQYNRVYLGKKNDRDLQN